MGSYHVIPKEAGLFCRTSSSVRLWWELEGPKGPWPQPRLQSARAPVLAAQRDSETGKELYTYREREPYISIKTEGESKRGVEGRERKGAHLRALLRRRADLQRDFPRWSLISSATSDQ